LAIRERINFLLHKGEDVTLKGLIKKGVVRFLEASTRDEALRELVDALGESKEIEDCDKFFEAILKREQIVSTGIGMGVAIPHAKLEEFDHFFLAVGVQKGKDGIEWESLDGAPVRLIFMIGGPVDKQTEYLKILSHLTAAIKDEERRSSLLNAESFGQVTRLFNL